MKENIESDISVNLEPEELKEDSAGNDKIAEAFAELERGVRAALETYSNVHRGSGHNSIVTTHLYEQARDIVLKYLGLNKGRYTVVFCTPRRAAILKALLKPTKYQCISSRDIGLAIGIRAMAVRKRALPRGIPFQTGGGTAKLISKRWVIWADAPDKFEAGTPAIINVIAFARALSLTQQYGKDIFKSRAFEKLTAAKILHHDELENYSGQELLEKLRQTLIGRGLPVPTMEGDKPFINLDNSASTPTFRPIWNTFRQMLFQKGQVQQEIIQETRTICAGFLGASPADYDILFTSNTTEAINLVAESLGREYEEDTDPVLVNTLLEHSSNDLPWRMVPHHSLIRLAVNADGFIDLKELETLLCSYSEKSQYGNKRIKLVAVSGASNVLGVCNNIEEISLIVHRFGARLLVDAAQLAAHHRIDLGRCNIDYLAFSAHKVYAPFGSGALIVRKGLLRFSSAEMELIRRSGEENAGGIAALGKAFVLLQRVGMDLIRNEEKALTERALLSLGQIQGIKIFGLKDPESPLFDHKIGVISFHLESMLSNKVAKELTLLGGIGIRSGCHCAHIIIKHLLNISPFLERFQGVIQTLFPKLRLPGLVRVSLGIENSEEDVDRFVRVLERIAGSSDPSQNARNTILRKEAQQQINDFTGASALRVYS